MDTYSGNIAHELIAGTIGGGLGISIVYPLDTAKMRLQTYHKYNSMSDVFKDMIKKDGFKSLYRGLASPALGFGLLFAQSFLGYSWACRMIRKLEGEDDSHERQLEGWEMFIAGGIAGLFQSPTRQIVERIKSVMQVRESAAGKKPFKWSGDCLAYLIRKEGVWNGLFRGLSATCWREIPQFAVYYPAYEKIKLYFMKITNTNKADHLNPIWIMLSGAIAGGIQWLPPFYSIDVVKSRMQSALPGTYDSFLDCIKKSYRAEGMNVFFKGLNAAMARAFPLHAFVFLGFEGTQKFLRVNNILT